MKSLRFFLFRKKRKTKPKKTNTRYLRYKEQSRSLILERLLYWNDIYNFTYHRVSIRDTKTRWGSCSKKGNLNFNYKIVFLPRHLVDYIVVHELCHLKEFNHSRAFWDLVGQTLPDYRSYRGELKSIRVVNTNIKNMI